MDKAELVQQITQKRDNLRVAAEHLKQHFVGLDDVIDRIIANIEVWYIMPDVITRPVIVNLWGMTGVGKTDLVRRLVRELNFLDNFIEIQLTNQGSSSSYHSSIQSILSFSNLQPDRPGILLLDEIQRFRALNEQGEEVHDYKFQDVWMLLSDGRFCGDSDSKEDLLQMVFEAMYWDDMHKAEETAVKPEPGQPSTPTNKKKSSKTAKAEVKKRKYQQSYYTARRLKKILRLPDSVDEIMQWDSAKQNKILFEKINDQAVYEGDDYSKLLIFISGNLDEAYGMSDNVEDADGNADVFYEHSLKINLITIKAALRNRFKPEQIARFGNTHVIYPSLSSASYHTIIDRRVVEIVDNIKNKYGITLHVDQTMREFIYRNGVFPTQGVRPLFSTISSCLENSLPIFLLKAIEADVFDVEIYYEQGFICAKVGSNIEKIKNDGDLDKIRKKNCVDKKVAVSVHEAGHSVAYSVLFGLVPTQIMANTTSDNVNGFVGVHEFARNQHNITNEMVVQLAGRCAEEMVFGEAFGKRDGSSSDIAKATSLAGYQVRNWGMSGYQSRIIHPAVAAQISGGDSTNHNDTAEVNDAIEQLVSAAKVQASALLADYKPLLMELSDKLIKDGNIELEEYQAICARHDIKTEIMSAKEIVWTGFKDRFEHFSLHGTNNFGFTTLPKKDIIPAKG